MATTDTLVKGYRDYCVVSTQEVVLNEPIRYMNLAEQLERDELNIANTSENLRARVLTELANRNGSGGHSVKPSTIT